MERTPKRLRDIPSAILFVLLMLVSSQRLYSTNWTTGLGTVMLLALMGSLLGLILGQSKFKGGIAFLLALGYSIILLPILSALVLYKDASLAERTVKLGLQLAYSSVQLVTGQSVQDSTLFIIFAVLVYWIVCVNGGYKLTRGWNFSAGAAPAGLILIIIQLFDMREDNQVYILALYAFLCLLLMGRLTYKRNREKWKKKRVWVSAEANTDINFLAGAAAAALVFLAWIAPVSGNPVTSARIAWENITRPWRDRQQDLNKTIQSLQSNQEHIVQYYGDTLGLGLQAETGNDTTLQVRAPLFATAERYYWRVRTYDLYQNDQWYTDFSVDELFRPADGSLTVVDPQGTTGEFVFTVPGQTLNLVATPQRPIWINRNARISFAPAGGSKIDPLTFSVQPAVKAGGEYIVHSNIYNPTVYQLRNAGAAYPDWVTAHYLQLPSNLPPEIGRLAQQITRGIETPYDKAAAITDYLRTNIRYSTTVEAPPQGQDMLTWFLFDTKTGFCNYYASAEVVLLRSLGIPARMAVGFAQGEYDPPNLYTVRKKDSHAWPEVYFPGSGWVEFEPTGNQAALERPAGGPNSGLTPSSNSQGTPDGNNAVGTPLPLDGGNGAGTGITQSSLTRLTIFFLVVALLIVGVVIAYTFGMFDKLILSIKREIKKPAPVLLKELLEEMGLTPPDWVVRWAYLAELNPVERSFSVVYRCLHWLGQKPLAAQTPAEAAAALGDHVPAAALEIQTLLEQYERALYSQQKVDMHLAHSSADQIWRKSLRTALNERLNAIRAIFKHAPERKKHSDGP